MGYTAISASGFSSDERPANLNASGCGTAGCRRPVWESRRLIINAKEISIWRLFADHLSTIGLLSASDRYADRYSVLGYVIICDGA